MNKKSSVFVLLVICILIIPLLYFFAAYIMSLYYFRESFSRASPNEIYNLQQKGIALFSLDDNYHRIFSQTTLAVADSLAATATSSATAKDLIRKLVIQAVSEAKTAISLAPYKSVNQANMGIIYKNLVGVSRQAKNFSLAFFQQAAKLAPNNPEYQVQIGNVYFMSNEFDLAQIYYQNADKIKKNYPPALYGLAQIEKIKNNPQAAIDNLNSALKLTPFVSPDYIKIKKEIIDINNSIQVP